MARYVKVTPELGDAVLQHLRDSFFADEPLNKAVQLCQRGQPHAALERLCTATIADGLSMAVLENDTVSLLFKSSICLVLPHDTINNYK
jgi:hypothetical protein